MISKYSVFDEMIEGVQVIDKKWRYHYLNDAAANQGKAAIEELLGHTMMEKYPGIENTELFAALKKCMEDRHPCQILNEFKFPDGTQGWFDLRIGPVEEGVLIMSFDVTEQKRMELQLRQLNDELESKVYERTMELLQSLAREKEMNKLKSVFVSMVSHEFRTPLSIVLSSINLIERYAASGEYSLQGKHIERIKSSLRNLMDILNDFLSVEKLEEGKIRAELAGVDLHILIQETIEELDGLRKEGQKINFTFLGEKKLLLDRKMTRNIILNLLSNAIKYSEKDIELNVQVTKEQIRITVTDRGIGIPDEERKNIFEKFFRARNAITTQGTGLGLNIVKRYAQLMGGTISFTSKQNEGTTFNVSLPFHKETNVNAPVTNIDI